MIKNSLGIGSLLFAIYLFVITLISQRIVTFWDALITAIYVTSFVILGMALIGKE